jgi:hypothetical protein
MNRSRSALSVEVLEDRCVPAAITLPLTSLNVGGVAWGGQGGAASGIGFIQGDTSSGITANSAFGIIQASAAAADGTVDNAYAGAFALAVNGTVFNNAGSSTVDLTGTTITSATQNISGLNTTVQYFFDPDSPTVRVLYSFSNPTTAAIGADIHWGNNIDSNGDGQPVVVASSSGDNVLDPADRWFITQTGSTSGLELDWVRFGPGTVTATPSATTSIPGQGSTPNIFADRYDLAVPAGQTVRLMFFGQITNNSTDALTQTAKFDSNTALQSSGLLGGLSAQQLGEIVNWNLNPAPVITSAPTATFGVGEAASFTITTTGSPAPLLSISGTLPPGLSFVDHENGTATISGTPTFMAQGTYPLTITAHNGNGPDAVQTFNLTVPPVSATRFIVAGAGPGGGPQVKVFNLDGSVRFSFYAYDPSFAGGVRVASGDINGDGVPDIITAPGPGGVGPGHVRVYDGRSGALVSDFVPYPEFVGGGIYLAAGDINGDGKADIITGTGAGGAPHIKVFSGADLSVLASFYAFPTNFLGGVRVASGDITGSGHDDIIASAGPGATPIVTVFDGMTLQPVESFYAYAQTFSGGDYVASGDFNGDGKDEVIVGPESALRRVKVFGADTTQPVRFVSPVALTNETRVSSIDFNGDGVSDIIYGSGPGATTIGIADGATLKVLDSFTAFPGFFGGVFVAGSRELNPPTANTASTTTTG